MTVTIANNKKHSHSMHRVHVEPKKASFLILEAGHAHDLDA